MSDLHDRLTKLSPEKQRLLDQRLRQRRAAAQPRATIAPLDRVDGLPPSFAQQRLWFLQQYEPESMVYNMLQLYRLRGRLDEGALRRAFEALIGRHQVLHTLIESQWGVPAQRVLTDWTFDLPLVDLSAASNPAGEAVVLQFTRQEVSRPFDLARDLPLRASLFKVAPQDHYLAIIVHHVASDAWSRGLQSRELSAFYNAFAAGVAPGLPPLPLQYADFAAWQRDLLQGELLDQHLAYWREQLGGELPLLNLPADFPRPAVQSFAGIQETVIFPAALAERLNHFSHEHRVTLFMTLLSAFYVLLYRYTGQGDLIVGSPVAGRPRPELEDLIGFFINNLVLRVALSGDLTFTQLLDRVREVVIHALSHQDIPFEMLVEEIQPRRDLSHSPLFQAMFNFINVPTTEMHFDGLDIQRVPTHNGSAMFDLSFYLRNLPAGLELTLEYSPDLFREDTIKRMAGHYHSLLEGILADPHRPIAEMPLLTPSETRKVLVEWNQTAREYPRACLHQLFEAQAARTPQAAALVHGREALSYQALNRQANHLARHLLDLGLAPGDLAGVYLDRGPELVVTLLAIQKAGGAYVPLDPSYPRERIGRILEDAQARFLISQSRLRSHLPLDVAQLVLLDAVETRLEGLSEENPGLGTSPTDLAYVIYTSGSTGRPKGVAIEHCSASALIHWALETYSPRELQGVLASTSINFDLSIFEIFVALSCGGAVYLAENALALPELPRAAEVTLINTVPSVMSELLRLGGLPASVCTINLAGESLPRSLVDRLYAQPNIERVYNLYGPSEDTTYSTCALVPRDDPGEPTIGRPIANTQAYVLDGRRQPLPVGVPGELYLGGEGVARGYLHSPELTAERFVPDPFAGHATARLYRTGDLARYLPNGELQFLGRNDHQVKLRGFRIELGEIEVALAAHPQLAEAVVLLRRDQPDDPRLLAYLVPAGGQQPSTKALLDHLGQRLPAYMLPAAFVFLDALPRTPNGKVDRQALARLDAASLEPDRAYLAPQAEDETMLVEIWESTLGVSPIGLNDDFFELGGHSLLAVRLFVQIESTFGLKLPLASLYRASTVAEQVALLRGGDLEPSWSSLVPIQTSGSKPALFCMAALGGNVLNYRALSKRLGPGQPIYALQSRGLDAFNRPLDTLEGIAAHNLEEIRTVQPHGPYYLCGTSFGGLTAYECAQQLHAAGEQVAAVMFFDTYRPNYFLKVPPAPLRRLYTLLGRVGNHLGNLMVASWRGRVSYLRQKWPIVRARAKSLFRRSWQRQVKRLNRLPHEIRRVEYANVRASRVYRPKPYPGRVVLFRARHQPLGYDFGESLGWVELAPDLEIHEVPGHHGNLVYEPRVKVLAREVAASLARIQSAPKTPDLAIERSG